LIQSSTAWLGAARISSDKTLVSSKYMKYLKLWCRARQAARGHVKTAQQFKPLMDATAQRRGAGLTQSGARKNAAHLFFHRPAVLRCQNPQLGFDGIIQVSNGKHAHGSLLATTECIVVIACIAVKFEP
jgi:hypothetical protein